MSDSLIEQVKRLAQKQGEAKCPTLSFEDAMDIAMNIFQGACGIDFPALLAHMQAQQAVVDAARELQAVLDEGFGHCPHCDGDHAADDQDEVICAKAAALDAASRILGAMK